MEPVVVRINGAFGVGKTSVAKALVRQWDGAVLFDPEQIGALLRRTIPRDRHTDDYQDFPLWRRLTMETVSGLATECGRPIVVPMTLTNDAYRQIGRFRSMRHVVIAGTVTARRNVRAVLLTGRANGSVVGIQSLGDISAGETEEFRITGIFSTSASRILCTIDARYLTSGIRTTGETTSVSEMGLVR